MKPHWILIADASRARLLQQLGNGPLVMLGHYEHPASRLHTSELADSQAGHQATDRMFGAAAYEPHLDAHEKEQQRFAHELASVLEDGAAQRKCDAITVFAPASFLGSLRQAFGVGTRKCVAAEYDADLTHVGTAELERRIAHEKAKAH